MIKQHKVAAHYLAQLFLLKIKYLPTFERICGYFVQGFLAAQQLYINSIFCLSFVLPWSIYKHVGNRNPNSTNPNQTELNQTKPNQTVLSQSKQINQTKIKHKTNQTIPKPIKSNQTEFNQVF